MIFKNLPDTTTPLNATNLNQFNEYSTNEIVIGKWIDGKPIYRKTFSCGALPDASQKEISTGMATGSVKIINIQAISIRYDGGSQPLPYATPSDLSTQISCLVVDVNNVLNIRLVTGIDRTSHLENYVTLEYTKTTD